MAGRFSVEAVFKAVDKITAPVRRIQNRVGKMARSMTRNLRKVDRVMKKVTSGIKRGARVAAIGFGILAAAMVPVISAGVGFEQAITNVGAVSLKTRDQIAPLEKMALQLGRTTKFTATQAANAMEVLARAGFKTNEILSATPAILAAAAASGLEIAEVANHVSNVLKGMGLEASSAAMVADVLALAASKTNSTIGSLGDSLSKVASTARQLKIPLQDTVAAVALLQDVGLDSSVAGTAFNVMLTKMAAPTAGMQKKMKRLGITFKDAKGNMLALPKVIEQLNIASKKVGGNFDKVAFFAELVGLRGQKAAANLADLFESGKLSTLTYELTQAEGAAKKMADIRMDTTLGSWLLLKSAVDAVKIRIFEMESGPLRDVIDTTTEWVGANEKLIAVKVSGFIKKLSGFLRAVIKHRKGILRVIVAIGAFVTVLKTLIAVMTVVNLAMAANPLVLIALAVIAVVTAVILAIKYFNKLHISLKIAFAVFMYLMGPIGWFILAATLIVKNWKPIKNFFLGLWGGITKGFNIMIEKIMAGVDRIKSGLKFVMDVGGKVGDFLGLGQDDSREESGGFQSQVVSPQERAIHSLEEKRSVSSAEVTIKDSTGRAEVTKGKLGGGLKLIPSGGW